MRFSTQARRTCAACVLLLAAGAHAQDTPAGKSALDDLVALAADDPLMGRAGVPIFERWRAAGKPVELHVYAAGDHGFGMRKTGVSADNWIEHYTQWMPASKLLPALP